MIVEVKTLNNGIKASEVVKNGPSPWYSLAQGCRQGDLVSPYLCYIVQRDTPNNDVRGYNYVKQ